ncbi:MAG: caspase family protein, partial [Rhodomicrobium sp.]
SLYCRSDGVRCRGAAVKYLSHNRSRSLGSVRLIPSHSGTEQLVRPAKTFTERKANEEAQRRLLALTVPANSAQTAVPMTPLAAKGRRVALVIGNSNYSNAGNLTNPANDARAIAATLRRTGFAEVIERYNLDLAAMIAAIKDFGDKTADADWAVVYYAGHGMEMNGVSYLIPTDAKLLRDTHAIDEALPLDRVLAKVETARRLRLVILDACRNNPFAARMVRAAGLNRSIGRGLARLEPEGGVLVAYSAKHGTLAQDGDGANSPFATALAAYLEEPGLEIQFLFRKVRDRVMAETGGAQEPFLYGSLGSEPLYFRR